MWTRPPSRRSITFSREVNSTRSVASSTSPKSVVSVVTGSKTAVSASADTPSPLRETTVTPRSTTSRVSMRNRKESAMPTNSSVLNWIGSFDQRLSGARRKRRCGPPSSRPSVTSRAFPMNSSEPEPVSMSNSSAAISASPPSQVS